MNRSYAPDPTLARAPGLPLVESKQKRGCGFRVPGGLYGCLGVNPGGTPIEAYVLDPVVPWEAGPFRGVKFHTRADGIVDMVLWVGAENYPFVSDFIEEARRYGVSKRLPISQGIDYSVLTPHQSRIVLVHPRGRYTGPARVRPTDSDPGEAVAPHITRGKGDERCNHAVDKPGCTFALWDLSALPGAEVQGHEVEKVDGSPKVARVRGASFDYHVQRPIAPAQHHPDAYRPAIVAVLPLGHFEYVNPDGGLPEPVAKVLGRNAPHAAVTKQ